MNSKFKFFIVCVIIIVFFLFVNKVLVPQNADSKDRVTNGTIHDDETGTNEDALVVDEHMFVEAENGVYVTSAVCVHNGKSYVLTEKEYIYLMNGGQMEEVLRQRQELN